MLKIWVNTHESPGTHARTHAHACTRTARTHARTHARTARTHVRSDARTQRRTQRRTHNTHAHTHTRRTHARCPLVESFLSPSRTLYPPPCANTPMTQQTCPHVFTRLGSSLARFRAPAPSPLPPCDIRVGMLAVCGSQGAQTRHEVALDTGEEALMIRWPASLAPPFLKEMHSGIMRFGAIASS